MGKRSAGCPVRKVGHLYHPSFRHSIASMPFSFHRIDAISASIARTRSISLRMTWSSSLFKKPAAVWARNASASALLLIQPFSASASFKRTASNSDSFASSLTRKFASSFSYCSICWSRDSSGGFACIFLSSTSFCFTRDDSDCMSSRSACSRSSSPARFAASVAFASARSRRELFSASSLVSCTIRWSRSVCAASDTDSCRSSSNLETSPSEEE
ncbi:hypothetical protein F5888DRAFT_1677090 [Russula emetica]|nr:hypothetical protein F5888DRAFT_1677090 [Russula emetica]